MQENEERKVNLNKPAQDTGFQIFDEPEVPQVEMPETYSNEYSPDTYQSEYEKCPHCGGVLSEQNSNFCQICGKRIFKGEYHQSRNSQSNDSYKAVNQTTQQSYQNYGSKVEYDANAAYKFKRTDYSGVNPPMVSSPKERDKTLAIILCALGFGGLGGLHKFYEGKVGLGILYLFTYGLFGIGTIVDLIKIAKKPGDKYIP